MEIKVTTVDPVKGLIEHESLSYSNVMPDNVAPSNVAYVARDLGQKMSEGIKPIIQETVARQVTKVFTDINETPST